MIAGTVYDPSYGVTYTSMDNFEDNAVAGFVVEKTLNEKDNAKDFDGNGMVEDKIVRVFLFRTNPAGKDLI